MRSYFCIGSFYGGYTLEALLEHLANLPCPQEHCLLVHRQYTKEPLGFSKVYNALVESALYDPDCDIIWIVGDDVLPVGDCIRQTERVLRENPDAAAVFPVEAWIPDQSGGDGAQPYYMSLEPFTGRVLRIPEDLKNETIEQIFAGFALVAIRRKAWDEIGSLDESLGRGYCEDLDWGLRAWHSGWRCLNYRNAWFKHGRGATYNKLVADGLFGADEPAQAALRVQEKWSPVGLWRSPAEDVMRYLRARREQAREKK